MKYIDEENLNNKKVILRCDFNVPIKDGIIIDDTRIVKSLKTINFLLDNNCSVILMSHLGRIKTKEDMLQNTLKPVQDKLSELLNRNVDFVLNPYGKEVIEKCNNLLPGQVLLLENVRFCDYPEKLESSNDLNLAKYWASLADAFVLDAFGSMHRAHASTAGISKYLPTYLGLLAKEELIGLDPCINDINHPFGVFMGGAKVDDKLGYIENLLPKCDYLMLGGGIANSFLYACGFDVGDSLCTSDAITLEKLNNLVDKYKDKIIFPVDFIFEGEAIYDLGEKSIEKYIKYLSVCKTIFINGTCGKFEEEYYANGTIKLFESLKDINAYKVAGGGDTLNFINKYHFNESLSFISSGGGASLEYLSSGHLGAIDFINGYK